MIIEGAISVKAAIESKKRKIEKVYIRNDKSTKDLKYIERICLRNNIPVIKEDKETIMNLSSSKSSGGIIALADIRKIDEFDNGDIFFLDGIKDPFNLGYSMRTLYAFGFRNVLLNKRDYSLMEAQLLKSSAGAYDKLNIQIAEDEISILNEYKNKGYHLYGLFRGDNSKDVFDCVFDDKSLFILGGEKRGISREILSLCDEYLYISYGSDFRNALNACAALDVVATLLYKQRKDK
ncbi:MAG: TrmH family RNA methyltransferase [Erysipelotrichaceae bacterium]|nr:TrmH family RNA methyltransferase [Erysipelotrichaceae bacterium]